MQETNIYIERLEGQKRQITWFELNQLKKDILWVFDANGNELHSSFIPDDSFSLPYWEYITISGDEWFYETDKSFYKEGVLIIILCMLTEYIDIQGGSQVVFGQTKIEDVYSYVQLFSPVNENQVSLKQIVVLGLSIAAAITEEDIAKNEDFQHPKLNEFYSKLSEVTFKFIQPYFKSKLR